MRLVVQKKGVATVNRWIALAATTIWLFLAVAPVSAQKPNQRSNVRGVQTKVVRPGQRAVVPASYYEETIVEGDGSYIVDSSGIDIGCSSCGGSGCAECDLYAGGGVCESCHVPNRFCICFPAHGWVHAEYLNWWQSGMNAPALASTGLDGTGGGGAIGTTNYQTLYGGGNNILTDSIPGFRIRFGWWLSRFPGWGIEGEYVGMDQISDSFFQNSNGTPLLARPFYNSAEDSRMPKLSRLQRTT